MAALIGLALMALCACSKPTDKAAQTHSGPAAPLTYAISNADVTAKLDLPEAINAYPVLHKKLYDEGRATLDRFAQSAGKDHADLAAQGFPVPAYNMSIGWTLQAQSNRLVSLSSMTFVDEGGAHPNEQGETMLWDKGSNQEIKTSDLIAVGQPLTAAENHLCSLIEDERSRRLQRPISQKGNCPKLLESKVVAVPSTLPGKLAGLDIFFDPYELGAYTEGQYAFRLPPNLVAPMIKPAYAQEFAGKPEVDELVQPEIPHHAY